jgi:hypothetical protein
MKFKNEIDVFVGVCVALSASSSATSDLVLSGGGYNWLF